MSGNGAVAQFRMGYVVEALVPSAFRFAGRLTLRLRSGRAQPPLHQTEPLPEMEASLAGKVRYVRSCSPTAGFWTMILRSPPSDDSMKTPSFVPALAVLVCAILFSAALGAQEATPRPRGGFDRPLADAPRFGNPGASPKLTIVEFRALLAHWEDFDTNKNQLLEKSEVPELFWKLFDQADLNHDGALDAQERALVMQPPVAPPANPAAPAANQPATTQAAAASTAAK